MKALMKKQHLREAVVLWATDNAEIGVSLLVIYRKLTRYQQRQSDHKMIHKRPRRIGVTALLLNIIQVKHSLFIKEKEKAAAPRKAKHIVSPRKSSRHSHKAESTGVSGMSLLSLQNLCFT